MKGRIDVLAVIVILALGFLLYKQGVLGNITNNFYSNTELKETGDSAKYTVTLSIVPNTICAGETTKGTITSNIYSGYCSIYYNPNTEGYRLYKNVLLNAAGSYSEMSSITATGQAYFRAICCDSIGNCKLSNEALLIINPCDDDGSDGSGSSGDGSSDGGTPPIACNAIWNPSQSTCATGACTTGTCVYIHNVLSGADSCECVSATTCSNACLIEGYQSGWCADIISRDPCGTGTSFLEYRNLCGFLSERTCCCR